MAPPPKRKDGTPSPYSVAGAWIFITLEIGIGAIWAYYVIGWGGYWGWDSAETSSLLLWLMITLFLYTQLRLAKCDLSPAADEGRADNQCTMEWYGTPDIRIDYEVPGLAKRLIEERWC